MSYNIDSNTVLLLCSVPHGEAYVGKLWLSCRGVKKRKAWQCNVGRFKRWRVSRTDETGVRMG